VALVTQQARRGADDAAEERHWTHLLPAGTLIILLAVANAVLVLRGAP
jgi:hypothetical protein